MWRVVLIACLSWSPAQSRRGVRQSDNGWDIRLAVPGEPGSDYPTLGTIPRTSFSCSGKEPGYYADLETSCQVFRICTTGSTYGFQSFLCPNGTLFNQAVFVCDWWMNVNCQRSQELFSNNNDKFGNLRLGPQLMKDIKKMLTHPMRNPYDKTAMKGNLIVMQDYRAPFGQMYPNGAYTTSRSPNSLYSPAKLQSNDDDVYSGNYAASTPAAQYVPPSNVLVPPNDAEIFQRQRNFAQSGKLQSIPQSSFINGHTGHFTDTHNTFFNSNRIRPTVAQNYNQPMSVQNYNQQQYGQISYRAPSQVGNQRQNAQYNRHSGQYTDGKTAQNTKQKEFGISYSKQQYNYNPSQPNANIGHINSEVKQNLVSNDVPATIVTKTLTFNRLVQDPKGGSPKSRITFKTWIVKPSKAARLVAEPTAYTYNRPTPPQSEKIVEPGYIYNPPATAQAAKLISEPEGPYTYNRPTVAAKLRVEVKPTAAKQKEPEGYSYNKPPVAAKQRVEPDGYTYSRPPVAAKQREPEGYTYNRPTVAAKQIATREPPRLYLTPTSPPPTLGRLYLAPTTPTPTLPARLYIPPTTYKPANLYLPPSQPVVLSRQYLNPNAVQQPAPFRSDKLRASPSTPTPMYAAPPAELTNNPSFTLTKQSRINANHNNLTFSDILTKEKLDITVNDIVSDTSSILKTAAPSFEQLRQPDKSVDYTDENYLTESNDESGEVLTPQSPTVQTSSRLIVNPARDLEPPVDNLENHSQYRNPLANLPFYKEPATNTIERTVSLKISIPEKVATELFKNQSGSEYDKLEILNTGSSNYLVLTNNVVPKTTNPNFIPLGRLIADKTSNISDSQALVFSFLADSLNAAKEYSNLAHQNVIGPTQVYQNINNEDISQLTNKISQLTASQYSTNNHNFNHATTVSTSQTNSDQYRAAKYTNSVPQNQPQQILRAQINSIPSQSNQGYPARDQSDSGLTGNLVTDNQVYSGQLYQLPVPDVTAQVYNAPAKLIQASNQHTEAEHLNENVNNNLGKQSDDVELIRMPTLPVQRPAKLQQGNEADTFNSHEHSAQSLNFLNNGNGISAQVQDKIVGTIPHPHEENKFVTYKKDQSYYIFSKLNNALANIQANQNAKLIQNQNIPRGVVTFQLVPSVSYQLEDEKDQQKILNAFNIDEYGNPKKVEGDVISSDVDYSVNHPAAKLVDGQYNEPNTLYSGPSSYSAPQGSVGSLDSREGHNNNVNARLEQLDGSNNGYPKVTPEQQFSF